MRRIALSPAPDYNAISYTWNDEQPSMPVICNGRRSLITPSLHGILEVLAQEDDDGLCFRGLEELVEINACG